MKKRGAGTIAVLARLILALVSAIIIAMFIKETAEAQQELFGRALCQNSITLAASDEVPDFSREGCVAGRVEIKKEQFEEDAVIENLVKKEIADLMLDCWNMVGKGRLMPYKRLRWDVWPDCNYYDYNLICSIVSFEDIDSFKGLNLWMINNKAPIKKNSYFGQLYGVPSEDVLEEHKKLSDKYDTSKEYAVIWKSLFLEHVELIPPEVEQTIPVKIVGEEWNGVLFVPYSEIIPPSVSPEFAGINTCIFVMN